MIAKITADIYVKVEDEERANEAVGLVATALPIQMRDFPLGEVLAVKIADGAPATEEEINEHGLAE
jgi:hypothetical protein